MELKEKQVVLVGLGRSSIAAARLLRQHGARPFISESEDNQRLIGWLEEATRFDIPCEIGGHSREAFEEAHLVIVSPGVPLSAVCLGWARANQISILGELEFAFRFCSSRFLAVTGTNGKTTVTTLLTEMIKSCSRSVALAGNNDTPLSLVALEAKQPEFVVLEVSSYQLETIAQFHPTVAAVLNLSMDHLGRHGSMEGYAAAKARIFMRQQPGDAVVLNADDPWTTTMNVPADVKCFWFSLRHPSQQTLYADDSYVYYEDTVIASVRDNPLPGQHNLANVLAALAVIKAAGFAWEGPLQGLRGFHGVEHRIELVLSAKGVDFYNDSKSTNTDSLRVALESFTRPVVLIAGGRGKGGDYAELRDLVRTRVKHLVTIGEDAPKMEGAFGNLVPVTRADSMMNAVEQAYCLAEVGDVVLLSPGCASFDMYDNFEDRGRDFKECLRRLVSDTQKQKEMVL